MTTDGLTTKPVDDQDVADDQIVIEKLGDLDQVKTLDDIAWLMSPVIGRHLLVSDVSACCKVKMRVTSMHSRKLEFKVTCLKCGMGQMHLSLRPETELTRLPSPGSPGEAEMIGQRERELR